MRPAGAYPCGGGRAQIGQRSPHQLRDGQLRHVLGRRYDLYIRAHEAEAVAHVHHAHGYSPSRRAVEHKTRGRLLPAYAERVRCNKAYYSLDCDDGIEYSACLHEPSPQELLDRKELFFRLWNALNSLPEIQGRRVDAHLILGKSYRQIAREEGVDKSAVRCSVKCGIERMKKYLQENF